MIAPAIPRWVAGILADEATGVNVLRATVPRGDVDPMPPVVAVYNTIDDAWVARQSPVEAVTPDLWALRVGVVQEIELAGNPMSLSVVDTATVYVMLDGVTDAAHDNAAALAMAFLLMRCVRRCLLTAFRAIRMEQLKLDQQWVTLPDTITLQTKEPVPGSGAVAVVALIPFPVQDMWARGA